MFDGERGIKSSSEVYDCSLGGSGVMHRADSGRKNLCYSCK